MNICAVGFPTICTRDDGFGVAYFYPIDHTYGVSITSFKDNDATAAVFAETLWDTFIEMRQLFEPQYKPSYKLWDLMIVGDQRKYSK